MKEELDSNCIPHYLTFPQAQGMGLTVGSLAGLTASAKSQEYLVGAPRGLSYLEA